MEHVISMEGIPDPFWDLLLPEEQPPVMTGDGSVIDGAAAHGDGEGGNAIDQSSSDWSFEMLLEDELLTDGPPPVMTNSSVPITLPDADPVVEVDHAPVAPVAVSTVGDPVEYNAILKRKLEEDLAAVAMWRASSVVHPERSESSNNYNGGNTGPISRVQNEDISGRLPTSSSSREPSPSDDDMNGELEILGFKMPTEDKVRKRKESNRESARRSRYRKAAHLKDLEDQVAQLRVDNSCLLRRLAALNQKYNDANVDNRVLRADMETLRAKVKMAEDALKRVIEMSSQPSRPISAPNNSDASLPIQEDILNYFTTPEDALVDNSFMPMMTAPSSLQADSLTISGTTNTRNINRIATHCAAAMELIHKTMGAMPTSSGSTLQESASLGPHEITNMDMH
ncbi:hypothetical protein BS78_02G056300 [Paspalum vaginatum]|nr:hypothetical protein BS78_02G056300 [Paspalum vaginatum]